MTQKELEQLFSQYGRIITSRILVDQVTGEQDVTAVPWFCFFPLFVPFASFPQLIPNKMTQPGMRNASEVPQKCNFPQEGFIEMHRWMEYKMQQDLMLHNSFYIQSPFVLHSPSPTFSPFLISSQGVNAFFKARYEMHMDTVSIFQLSCRSRTLMKR